MKTTPDKSATKAVAGYAIRYASNNGLRPVFPRLVVGMMRELLGWPVRNADGGGNIAHFSTMEAADASIAYARRAFRTAFNTDWCVTGEGR
jgi:hypothetical protein